MEIDVDVCYAAFDAFFYKLFSQYISESSRFLSDGPVIHLAQYPCVTNVLCYVYAKRFRNNVVSLVGVSLLMYGARIKIDVRYCDGVYKIINESEWSHWRNYDSEGSARVKEHKLLASYIEEFLRYMTMRPTQSEKAIFNFETDQHVFVSLSVIRYLRILRRRIIGCVPYY